MKQNSWHFNRLTCCGGITAFVFIAVMARAQSVKPPPTDDVTRMSSDLLSTDPAAQASAVDQMRAWLTRGWVSQSLWRQWLPVLVKLGKHQDVADLAFLGLLSRPGPEGITPLMGFRTESLLALNKGDDALQAAKSYYNVCDIKLTGNAVDMLGLALAKVHPEDGEIVRRFRGEQADAAAGKALNQPGMLANIKIDAAPYDSGLKRLAGKTRFSDRVGYANLLLAADKGADAEKVFRELFQLASTQAELTQATEGIAKALRAEDGNVGRANAWLLSIQKSGDQPTNTPQSPTTQPGDSAIP